MSEPIFVRSTLANIAAYVVVLILFAGPVAIGIFGVMELMFWLKNGAWAKYHLAMYSPPIQVAEYEGVRQIVNWLWYDWIGYPLAAATAVIWALFWFLYVVLFS